MMIAFLVLALCIVFAGMFTAVRWLAIVGTCLLLVGYVLALADNRRRRRKPFVIDRRWP